MKGPCDLLQILQILQSLGRVDLETNFVNEHGVLISAQSHSVHIIESTYLSAEEVNDMAKDFPFIDARSFETEIFSGNYDVIFLSTLVDTYANVYRNKKTGARIVFKAWDDLTDSEKWADYVSGKDAWYCDAKYTYEMLRRFRENFEYEGPLEPEEIVENYKKIRSLIPEKVLLVIMLGIETAYDETKASIIKATRRKKINPLLEKEFADCDNVKLINYSEYVNSRDDYLEIVDHLQRRVQFQVADDMVKIANEFLKKRGLSETLSIKSKFGKKTLLWITNPFNYELYNYIKPFEEKDLINIVGYAIVEGREIIVYEKLGGKIIDPPSFEMAIVMAGNNFHEQMKILESFQIPQDVILDGRVFQIPNLNLPKFFAEGMAYGEIEENGFSDESRTVHQRVFLVGGNVAVSLGKESYAKKIFFSCKNVLGEMRVGNYTSILDNVKVKFFCKPEKNFVSVYDFGVTQIQNRVHKILIGSDVKINSDATLIASDADNPLVIGDGAIIEDNAVITKDVPPYAIVAGNPAQIIDYRFSQEIIDALQKIKWWDWDFYKIKKNFPNFKDAEKFIAANENFVLE